MTRIRRAWLVGALAALGAVSSWLWSRHVASDRLSESAAPKPPVVAAKGARPEVAALIAEAYEVCDRLVRRFPHAPESHDVKGWALFRFGNSTEAAKSWQRCLDLNSTFSSAHYWLGRCAFDREDYAQAVECFSKALDLEPGSNLYPVYLANALMRLARFEDAVSVLERALKARPRDLPVHVLLGQAYLHLRRYEEAKQTMEKAIALAPDYTSAYYTLATACDRLGEKEKARQYRVRFRSLKERDQREEREILKRYDDAAEVREGVARVYSMAANVYEANGDAAEAESHRRRAAELDSDDSQAAGSRRRVHPATVQMGSLPALESLPVPEPARH